MVKCATEVARLHRVSIQIDGDLDESIKRNASDRLGDLVPQVRARTSPGVFRDMALLGLCLELSFNFYTKLYTKSAVSESSIALARLNLTF